MAKVQSPLLGYNTNVRHKGRVFHIQTEDSGINKPHVITHVFADGGRILRTTKTSYAQLLGADDLAAQVKKLMQDQHKAMFVALRDGAFDAAVAEVPPAAPSGVEPAVASPVVSPPTASAELWAVAPTAPSLPDVGQVPAPLIEVEEIDALDEATRRSLQALDALDDADLDESPTPAPPQPVMPVAAQPTPAMPSPVLPSKESLDRIAVVAPDAVKPPTALSVPRVPSVPRAAIPPPLPSQRPKPQPLAARPSGALRGTTLLHGQNNGTSAAAAKPVEAPPAPAPPKPAAVVPMVELRVGEMTLDELILHCLAEELGAR